MVNFTPRIAAAVLAFAVLTDALAVSASRGGDDVDVGVGKMVKLHLPTVDGVLEDLRIDLHTRSDPTPPSSSTSTSSTSNADSDAERPLLRQRSYPGPRRLDSHLFSPFERRGRHGKHGKHDKHGTHRHHGHSRDDKPKANGTAVVPPAGGNVTAPLPPVVRRDVYVAAAEDGPSIHIRPLSYYAQDTPLHIRELSSRGLLDPMIPILDDLLPPGLKGIVSLVPELLGGLLGPALGDLVISPNKAAHAAEDGSKDELDTKSQYVLAAAKSNPSTIWLVDTGKPVPPSSDAPSSTSLKEKMVSLQMAFVDAKTSEFEAYCATYERDPKQPVSLGVVPCKDADPAESQIFAYDPQTSVLRAIWGDEKTAGGKTKRQYFIGGGSHRGDVRAEGAGSGSTVVMVFQASNGTDGAAMVHAGPGPLNSTVPTGEKALDTPPTGPTHGLSADEKNSTNSANAQGETPSSAEDDADANKSVDNTPTAPFANQADRVSVLGGGPTDAVSVTSDEANITPVFVEHESDLPSAAATATHAA